MASEVTFWVRSVKDSTQTVSLHQFSTGGELLETVDTDIAAPTLCGNFICALNDTIVFDVDHYIHTVLGDRTTSSYEATTEGSCIGRIQLVGGRFFAFADTGGAYAGAVESTDGINWTITPLGESNPDSGLADIHWVASENKYLLLYMDPSGEVVEGEYRVANESLTVVSDAQEHLFDYTFGTGSGAAAHIYYINGVFYQCGLPIWSGTFSVPPAILVQTGTAGTETALLIGDGDWPYNLFFDTADGKLSTLSGEFPNYTIYKLASDGGSFVAAGAATETQRALSNAYWGVNNPDVVATEAGYAGVASISDESGDMLIGALGTTLVALPIPTGYTREANGVCMDARDKSLFWTENIRTREYL